MGTALDWLRREQPSEWKDLRDEIRNWPFLAYLLHNVEASVLMADTEIMQLYASLVHDPGPRRSLLDTVLAEKGVFT